MSVVCYVADIGSANPVDFEKLRASEKCVGVILRATRSNCAIDPLFASRADVSFRTGLLTGAYGFNTGEPAQTQATRFINITAPFGGMLRALDFEPNPSGSQMSLDSAIQFLDLVDQKFGVPTWLYSGSRIKQLVTHATDAQRDFLEAHPLWGSEYGPKWKNIDVNGHPLPWENGCVLWQFTDGNDGPLPHTFDGLEPHTDLSIFHGTAAQLGSVWHGVTKIASVPTPVAPPAPEPSSTVSKYEHLVAAIRAAMAAHGGLHSS